MRILTETLIEKYQDNVYRAAYNVLRNPSDAEDVTQDVFVRYHTGTQEFDSEEHIRAWLLRVAVNRALDICRNPFRNRQVSWEDYEYSIPFQDEESAALFEAVMSLPRKYRILIHLYYYEGFSVREISGILKMTEGSVRTGMHRARKLLKKQMEDKR